MTPTPETVVSLPAASPSHVSPSHASRPIASPTEAAPWWGRIETLWLLMAPLCGVLFALALPLAPNDLWYHVRAGEFIARGSIPTQNGMSLAVPLTASYYYQSWLAELLLFQTLQQGGLSGLMVLRALALGIALGCAVCAAWRSARRGVKRENSASQLVVARWCALAGVVSLALLSNNIDLRPQSFSVLLFGLWMVAIGEFRAHVGPVQGRWGAVLVVLTAIWANTHGAFAVSILALAALALGDLVARSRRAKGSLALLGACLVAVALNPRGLKLFVYVAQLSNNEIGQKFIQEWKSPGLDEWHSVLFWLMALIFTIWLAFSRHKWRRHSGEILVLALFLVMAARDQRAIIWFALWMVPMLVALGVRAPKVGKIAPFAAPIPHAARFINAGLLLFLALSPVALFPGVKADWPWPAEFRRRFAPPSERVFPDDPPLLLENSTPTVAAAWLLTHPPRGRLFTDMVCGSYLTYATYPSVKPWCDPRIELFPTTFWLDYLRLCAGPPDAAQQLEKRGFSDALLDRSTQPALVKRLRQSGRWKVVAASDSTVLLRLSSR